MVIEFFIALLMFFCGLYTGFLLREAYVRAQKRPPAPYMGLYGDPNLAYWYRMRASESDPYWARMPLRRYIEAKRAIKTGDIH